jgi:DNA-binding NarL/FixJ family response regulator
MDRNLKGGNPMSLKILVVDDTKFMRKMLTDILKQFGYEVVGEAENGRQAIQRYEELRPDVVVLDITMPEMDGIEAMKGIRRIDPYAIVLICSAMSQQDLISDALKAGANGYIMKPFKPNRVDEIIRKYGMPRVDAE